MELSPPKRTDDIQLLQKSEFVCELSIVMPCLNEAETLAACIRKAHAGLAKAAAIGEVVVADNGSSDGSIEIAEREGARIAHVKAKGYGNALRGGINAARGRYVLMGDSDDSYDFSEIAGFVSRLREGYDLVMGCRLPAGGGTIAPGAMPWKNRWIGNPILSFLGRLFFRTPIHDFQCGLRAFSSEAYRRMGLKTTGMEFASEMVIQAQLKGLRVAEVPITLYPDGRSRPPHLKPWRDGWRHLRFMLIYSPRWLFLFPGLMLFTLGLAAVIVPLAGPAPIGRLVLDVGTMIVGSMVAMLGFQLVAQAFYAKVFAIGEGLLPNDPRFARLFRLFNLERGCITGLLLALAGASVIGIAFVEWGRAAFGPLDPAIHLRRLVLGVTLTILGLQTLFSSFHLSLLGLKTLGRQPPAQASDQESSA